jgi:hypothetical protein
MILGLCALVVGNILVWRSDEETTQFFSGWVLGVLSLILAPAAPRLPRFVLAGVAGVFIIMNEQTITTGKQKLDCVHGDQRIIGGVETCVCVPPYTGDICDTCAPGAINEGNETHQICYTCRQQYRFPHCANLSAGYQTEQKCFDRWVPSCRNDNSISLPLNFDKTYENAEGVRALLYDVSESMCINDFNGIVYCDKCKEGHAGPDCCPDGSYGQNCSETVPACNADMDYDAVLNANKIPTGYGLTDPEICYNASCTCGGEFIGDSMCVSNFCVDGKCSDLSRVPLYKDRCDCDVGVGPDCVTPTCYGGTRMWSGKGICRCNAKHTDSYGGLTFDSCEKQTDGDCYPGLFGSSCQECQCAVDVKDPVNTRQCPKTHYGVFERDFRTKDYIEGDTKCMDSGICTNEPDDCGSEDRCLLFTNQQTFSAILFSGDNCTNTTDSKCKIWEPCRPI